MSCTETNVAGYLLEGRPPERVALRFLDADHTFGELHGAVRAVAGYLRRLSREKGERVLLVGDNSMFWVAAYLGTLRAGLVCVPLPTATSPQDLDYIVRITEARIVLADSSFAKRNGHQLRRLHLLTDRPAPPLPAAASQLAFEDLLSDVQNGVVVLPETAPHDLAALMFTSGSTGTPRGVMVSHRNIIANTDSIIQYLRLTPDDRIMTVLPFHYCFGTSLLHTHLRVGASLVVDPRFLYPEVILQRMIETECTGFAGVPSHFQILLRRSTLREKKFPHLRYVQQAGGHLAPVFIRELRQALPETDIVVMYGQTEATARLSYLPPALLERKLGSIGKGIPGVKLRVVNDSGQEVRPGEVGEIVAEGDNITSGYWRAPEETARCFREGKLHTGDLGQIDDEGFIYLVGRSKDFLKCGGKRISCRVLEEGLLAFDGLLEAAVIGIPDELLGEAVKAFVVPRNGENADLEERLRAFCRERFPVQLVPKEIAVVPALPKNSAGKVLKQELKEA